MRQNLCVLVTLACLVISAASEAQQSTPGLSASRTESLLPLNPQLYGISQWRVGESSEYLLVTTQDLKKEVKKLRFAILGEEAIAGSRYYVVESQVTDLSELRHTSINSVVRPFGDLTNLVEGAIGNFVTKQDTDPARAIPVRFLQDRFMSLKNLVQPPEINSVETFGEEGVATNAGKFKSSHQKFSFKDGKAAEVWWNGRVGPLGLVKVVSKQYSLDLLSHQQRRSVSAITEVPKPVLDQ